MIHFLWEVTKLLVDKPLPQHLWFITSHSANYALFWWNFPPVKFIIVSISNAANVEKYKCEEQSGPAEGTCRPANSESSLLRLPADECFLFGGWIIFRCYVDLSWMSPGISCPILTVHMLTLQHHRRSIHPPSLWLWCACPYNHI